MSTLAKIQFSYSIKFTPAQQQQVMDLAFDAPFVVEDKDREIWSPIIMLIEDAMKFGPFEVKQILQYHILDRISAFQQREASVVNEKCKVIVPGLGTLTIDTVKACVDMCTERLQDELSQGWKIVAVCVQPDQRRPDYILGKTTGV